MDCMAGVLAKHKSEKKGGQERTRQDQLRSNPAPALIESLNFLLAKAKRSEKKSLPEKRKE